MVKVTSKCLTDEMEFIKNSAFLNFLLHVLAERGFSNKRKSRLKKLTFEKLCAAVARAITNMHTVLAVLAWGFFKEI